MSAETPRRNDASELPVITGKEFRRATYTALALFAAVGLMAMMFRRDLEQLLDGQQDVAILTVAALILIVTHMNLMRMASRRANFNKQTVLMIKSHLDLDEAIGVQLKEVIGDTENAAMMLIMEVRKLSDSAKVVESISNQQESHEDMRQYYKMLFSILTEHNTILSAGIAEILDYIQLQDVVRQRIERMENAMAKRNMLFQEFARGIYALDAGLLEFPTQMRGVLDEYLSIESHHASSSDNASGQDAGTTRSELF